MIDTQTGELLQNDEIDNRLKSAPAIQALAEGKIPAHRG